MNTERTTAFVVALIFLSLIVYLFTRQWINPRIEKMLNKFSGAPIIEEIYAREISKDTDVNLLTNNAVKMLKGNQINCALINLKQATKVDPAYKESWFWLGYAYLQNNNATETISALKEAAKIDPIDPRTFQYLSLAYEQSGNADSAKIAKEKYEFLNNTK